MRKLALVVMAAAGFATIAPVTGFSVAKADPSMKLAQVGIEIRTDRDRDREYREHHRRDCREITIRERRGDDVVVRATAGKPPGAIGGDRSVVKQVQNIRTNLTNC